uniref:Uncharacterized protein n=1 Tax=Aegilops tauschii TaxID=37682 RepID=R7W4E7_AEGTA
MGQARGPRTASVTVLVTPPPATCASATPDQPDEPPSSGRGGRYHPWEDIAETLQLDDGEPARLTDAESARTIVEVNNNATVMISTLIDDGVHERIILPEFPYLTDENGDIYFEVDNDDAVMENIMGDDKIAVNNSVIILHSSIPKKNSSLHEKHVIIGLDNTDVFADLDLAAASSTSFAQEEEEEEEEDDDSDDSDDEYEEEGIYAVDEEDGDDDGDDDEEDDDAPNWSNLETVNSCHPLYFARMIVENASKSSIDWLDRPPASLVVEDIAFLKHSTNPTAPGILVGDEPLKDDKKGSGATFFKVEVLSIELITAYGTEPKVKIEEYRKSRPDIIAHSAPNIISRLRAGGDKITQALKSLCWRCKAIQVEEAAIIGVDCLGFDLRLCSGTQVQTLRFAFPEEAAIIGVDCLGFDLRLCSGTQVQTLRFAFPTKASSEFSAEKQIHELLFPRRIHQEGESPQAQPKEY